MTTNTVKIHSGEKPKYFTFGAGLTQNTTTVQASNGAAKTSPYSTFQGILTGTGTCTATIQIQVTNDDDGGPPINWCTTPLCTITLNGTAPVADGVVGTGSWRYVRANVTVLTGTGATLEVLMGN